MILCLFKSFNRPHNTPKVGSLIGSLASFRVRVNRVIGVIRVRVDRVIGVIRVRVNRVIGVIRIRVDRIISVSRVSVISYIRVTRVIRVLKPSKLIDFLLLTFNRPHNTPIVGSVRELLALLGLLTLSFFFIFNLRERVNYAS